MASEPLKSVVYFDGSCPLCRSEIGYYRRMDRDQALGFVDVSDAACAPPDGVTRQDAMKRFHVRAADGRVLCGAAAFVEVWSRLPGWTWVARLARGPGVLVALEWGYRRFLPVRPRVSRLVGRRPPPPPSGRAVGRDEPTA